MPPVPSCKKRFEAGGSTNTKRWKKEKGAGERKRVGCQHIPYMNKRSSRMNERTEKAGWEREGRSEYE